MEVLKERLPECVLAATESVASESPIQYRLDLGEPTNYDTLGPEIAAMRDRGVSWAEIGRVTGVGTGNAHNIWKRWSDSQRVNCTGRA
jgi:hypothetical protein